MTDIYKTPAKKSRKDMLFHTGVEALEKLGNKVERIEKFGKSSVRRITKGGKSRKVAIRTSQDTCVSFPRNDADNGWVTLSEVDVVVVVSVDDRHDPKFAKVHMIEADKLRERFDRAYKARMAAKHTIPPGRGVWLSLYAPDATHPVSQVGAGAGLDYPPIATVPLEPAQSGAKAIVATKDLDENDKPLTFPEAKRRLAKTLGVDESTIKITVEA
jgi:hypothetical protein